MANLIQILEPPPHNNKEDPFSGHERKLDKETYKTERQLTNISVDEKSKYFNDNLAEFQQQIDLAIRGVDEHRIDNIQVGETKIRDDGTIVIGDDEDQDKSGNLDDEDEGFVIFIAIR